MSADQVSRMRSARRGSIRKLSDSIVLFTPSTKGVSLTSKEEGQFGASAVLGLVMTFATVALLQRVLGRDFLGARE